MSYYNLFVFEDGQWSNYFGDYKRLYVVAEMHELHHGYQGIPISNMIIKKFECDDQGAIDAALDKLNEIEKAGLSC